MFLAETKLQADKRNDLRANLTGCPSLFQVLILESMAHSKTRMNFCFVCNITYKESVDNDLGLNFFS